MFCSKCGKPLPNTGVVCKFCGTLMSEEQIKENMNAENGKPELKTDKYGQSNIGFRDDKFENENKLLGLIIVGGIVLFIIVLAIIINVMR